jgi:hypothetical protein
VRKSNISSVIEHSGAKNVTLAKPPECPSTPAETSPNRLAERQRVQAQQGIPQAQLEAPHLQ